MKTIATGAGVALILAAALLAHAQQPAGSRPPAGNDVAAQGAALASQGAAGVAPCSSCHGAQGEGQAAAGFPRLAGQSAPYLQRQLDAYAEGFRTNPVMQPIAKAMTPAQRVAAAAHYAGLAVPSVPPTAATSSAQSGLGRTLATVGAQDRDVQACANCHGPDGVGEWATYPSLAGQHATYLRNALAEWKDGSRRTDASGQMQRIAGLLTPADTDAVVAYFAALPASPTMRGPMVATALRGARATIVSGPTGARSAGSVQGVGSEQGAPLTGGTQGVGGPGNPTGPQSGAPNSTSRGASAARP